MDPIGVVIRCALTQGPLRAFVIAVRQKAHFLLHNVPMASVVVNNLGLKSWRKCDILLLYLHWRHESPITLRPTLNGRLASLSV